MSRSLSDTVLVRADFSDDGAWESLLREVATPDEDGFLADVQPVDDPAYEGLTAEALRARHLGDSFVAFIADETTFRTVEHPILAVWVYRDAGDTGHEPFRVAAAVLWSVENNISLANMDWRDFTTSLGADGVYRGF